MKTSRSSAPWTEVERLLDQEHEGGCLLATTVIQPIRLITVLYTEVAQIDVAGAAPSAPCWPDGADVCADQPSCRRVLEEVSLTTGRASWRLVSAPADGIPLGPAPLVSEPHVHWNEIPGARWVGSAGVIAAGTYTFELEFHLPAASSELRGHVHLRTDDDARVHLNGNLILQMAKGSFAAEKFTTIALHQHERRFRPGEDNALQIVVTSSRPRPVGFVLLGTLEARSEHDDENK